MSIYEQYIAQNAPQGLSRRSKTQVLVDDLEELLLEAEFEGLETGSLEVQLESARAKLRAEQARKEDREYGKASDGRQKAPEGPDEGFSEFLLGAFANSDPQVAEIFAAVERMAKKLYRGRQNLGTVMSEDDFVQEARLKAFERLHSEARRGKGLPAAGAFAGWIREAMSDWQSQDKWAQSARPGNLSRDPNPGDPYTMQELKWALEDLHNAENWHDPAILGAIKKIQNPRYREALEEYFETPKPKAEKSALSAARSHLLLELNMEAPIDRTADGPGTRKVITNARANEVIEGERSYWNTEGWLG